MDKANLINTNKVLTIFYTNVPIIHNDERSFQCRRFVRNDFNFKEQFKTCNLKRLWLKEAANINEVIREEQNNIKVRSYSSVRKINSKRLGADDLDADPLIT